MVNLMSESRYKIAVLLPTRARGDMLNRSLHSLLDLASDRSHIQLIMGLDRDDQEGIDRFIKQTRPWLQEQGVRYTALTFEPLGYTKLNRYYNAMAREADADWLFVWNDDAVMQTQDWDLAITKYTGQFRLLKVHTHNEHPYSIFPIVPRAWFDALGHLSEHQMIDAELSQSAFCLDIMQVIDVDVTHHQVELTNDQQDSLGRKTRLEGNPRDPLDFHNAEMTERRFRNINRLSEIMQSRGDSVKFWQNVLAGRQDPWQRLKELDVNHQMVQFESRATAAEITRVQTHA